MRIVVVGGGIAGLETVLTLARTLPAAELVLVSEHPRLHLLPNLVDIPFGAPPERIAVGLDKILGQVPVEILIDQVQRIDTSRHELWLKGSAESLAYDALVAAPGAAWHSSSGYGFRRLEDAVVLRSALTQLAERGGRLVVRELSEATWRLPACEFAFRADAWRRSLGADRIEIALVTEESLLASDLGYPGAAMIDAELRRRGIEVLADVHAPRMDFVGGDVFVDVPVMYARTIAGLPHTNPDGWYRVNDTGAVCGDHFVVGDATDIPIRAAFATGWHARRVAQALGGDLTRLGDAIDGVPVDELEYQMDLFDGHTLRARSKARGHLKNPHLAGWTDIEIVPGQSTKLRGTLLRQCLATVGADPLARPAAASA